MWRRRSVLVGAAGLLVAAMGRFAWIRGGDEGDWSGDERVRSLWIGAVTPTSVSATVRTNDRNEPTRLLAATDAGFAEPLRSVPLMPDAAHFFTRGEITGLRPDTSYHLGVEVGGVRAPRVIGRFRTPPAGAHGFRFGLSSCAENGSRSAVFDVIRGKAEAGGIDFFVHMGDLHYANIDENDAGRYHAAYDGVFASPPQAAAWRSLPMYYMWDDHDFGPNGSHGGSPGRQAAVRSYRARVPSPPLASPGAEDPVDYSFVRGRVRFVATDLRSAKSDPKVDDFRGKIMLGPHQKAWFRGELRAARHAGQVVCWINTHIWLGATDPDSDRWFGYVYARAEMAQMIAEEGMEESIFIVSGDMHALAYDDGRNNAWGGFPVLQAAPLDKSPTQKGGPYSAGPFPTRAEASEDREPVSQYAIVGIEDGGRDVLAVRFVGYRVDRETGAERVILDETFARRIPTGEPSALQ
jgi:phosphodiesterase/alkaline phosphatase D-like protein